MNQPALRICVLAIGFALIAGVTGWLILRDKNTSREDTVQTDTTTKTEPLDPACVIELGFLKGREKLGKRHFHSLITV